MQYFLHLPGKNEGILNTKYIKTIRKVADIQIRFDLTEGANIETTYSDEDERDKVFESIWYILKGEE